MPLPGNITTIILTGRYLDFAGAPITGTVTITPESPLLDPGADTVIVPQTITETLDGDGEFSAVLVVSDDPDLTPTGFTYRITENFVGGRSYNITLTSAMGPTVDLADIAPGDASSGSYGYLTAAAGAAAYEAKIPRAGASTGDVPVLQLDGTLAFADVEGAGGIPLAQKGAANGVATLDASSLIPDAQIPASIARDTEVAAAVAALVNSAPGTLDTLGEIATALAADESVAAALATTVAGKASQASLDTEVARAGTAEAGLLARQREISARPGVLDVFNPQATDVAVQRISATLYYLLQHLGGRRYYRIALRRSDTLISGAPPGGAGASSPHILHYADIVVPMLSLDDDDVSVVRTGAGWGQISQALAYGGDYYRTTTAGDSVTWTTPANVSRVGLRIVKTTNAGVGKVEIDGDATRANLLPTAQQLVDAGTLASTVLVANGGTLNPTDRVLNEYAAAADNDVLASLADDLTPGVHTVKVTCTGYKQAASSDFRLYLAGVSYATPATTLTTASTVMFPLRTILGQTAAAVTNESAWEYAHAIVPTGGTTNTFVGSLHGYEFQDSIAFTVDDVAQTLTDGQTITGQRVAVTRVSKLRHPDTGATNVASVTTVLTMDADGLRVQHTTTWLVSTTVNTSYAAMLPVLQAAAQSARVYSEGAAITLTAHDGSFKGHAAARVVALWETTGRAAVALYLPDPSTAVANWTNAYFATTAAGLLSVQDNSGSPFVKAYATRVATGGGPVTAAVAAVWTSDSYRKATWLPAGANAPLVA